MTGHDTSRYGTVCYDPGRDKPDRMVPGGIILAESVQIGSVHTDNARLDFLSVAFSFLFSSKGTLLGTIKGVLILVATWQVARNGLPSITTLRPNTELLHFLKLPHFLSLPLPTIFNLY
jgi:hypothetical protein